MIACLCVFFFFFKQKTAYEMRISDWSSDVCSSDLSREILQQSRDLEAIRGGCAKRILGLLEDLAANQAEKYAAFWREFGRAFKEGVGEEIGRASCRERVGQYV